MDKALTERRMMVSFNDENPIRVLPLIELMIAVATIGILAAVSLQYFKKAFKK